MRRLFVFLLIVIVGIISVLVIHMLITEKGHKEEKPSNVTNFTLDKGYFDRFRQIIESNDSSPKEKEKAILNMAQFAVMLNDTDRVVEYLKDVAMRSENEIVIAASYAAIDLIRDYYPIEPIGELIVNADGELKPDSLIKIVATIKVHRDCSGSVGITRIHRNLELTSDLRHKFKASSGDRKDFVFEFVPKAEGEYPITVSLFLSIDRFDYQEIRQKIVLKVSTEGGEVIYLSE